ncbi:MAG: hypothetical protein IPP71_15680 [Bacteroidetes bacterium]|nr:hypothetical protein [Bacteroidota bacterium]
MSSSLFRKVVSGMLFFIVFIFASCSSKKSSDNQKKKVLPVPVEFSNYWNGSEAEVSSFNLLQSRFGEIHKGQAVLIFETKQFSRSLQLTTEKISEKKDDIIQVLRMNQSRNFNTGISATSTMTEVVTPVNRKEGNYALKVTGSVQEWAGQTYLQLNLDPNKYHIQLRSLLESQSEQNQVALLTFPEDQFWCTIRINPKDLPVGEMLIIPGLISSRFRNTEIKAMKAKLTLTKANNNELGNFVNMLKYSVSYMEDERVLEIFFKATSPYQICGWKETYSEGTETKSKKLTTIAILSSSIKSEFRTKSSANFTGLRDSLGLSNSH